MARLLLEEAMHTAREIADTLAEALPQEANLANALVAVGMVTNAIISDAPVAQRAELVEKFCSILRNSVSGELN